VTCAIFFLAFLFATPFLAAGPVYDENHSVAKTRKNENHSSSFSFFTNITVEMKKLEYLSGNFEDFIMATTQIPHSNSPLPDFDEPR